MHFMIRFIKINVIAVAILLSYVSFAGNNSAEKPSTQDLLKKRLELLTFRHEVLTRNVANINTPGYKADEVEMPRKFKDLISPRKGGVKMHRTSALHMAGNKQGINGKFATVKLQDPHEVKKNGNNVSLSQQVTKISQNDTEYSGALKAYQSISALVPAVLGR